MENQKVVLITGASSGIGKETAKQLLGEGYIVYTVARRLEQMEDLKSLGAYPLKMDITVEEDVQTVLQTIREAHGGIDMLINNAGYAIYGAVEDTSIEDARRQFEVNIFGLARLTQLVIPEMRQKKSGKIVNISSIGGKIYTPLGAWYHATKHALEGWSDCLRLELKPFGIDVIIIEPGGIKTEFTEVMNAPMIARSGNTIYGELARKLEKAGNEMWQNDKLSHPSVIAKTISKALKARRPKTRYSAGYMAFTVLFLRRWLSDRMFDRVIMSAA